jgi:hypothetical protein
MTTKTKDYETTGPVNPKDDDKTPAVDAPVTAAGIAVHDTAGGPLWLRGDAIDAWQEVDPTQPGRVRLWLRSGQVLVVEASAVAHAAIAAAVR